MTTLEAQISKVTTKILDARGLSRKIDLDAPLGEEGLGLDSMGRLELLRDLEGELKVTIPEDQWDPGCIKTLRNLIDVLTNTHDCRA